MPGESQGQRSLAGCSPWGHKELERLSEHTHTLLRSSDSFSQVRARWVGQLNFASKTKFPPCHPLRDTAPGCSACGLAPAASSTQVVRMMESQAWPPPLSITLYVSAASVGRVPFTAWEAHQLHDFSCSSLHPGDLTRSLACGHSI